MSCLRVCECKQQLACPARRWVARPPDPPGEHAAGRPGRAGRYLLLDLHGYRDGGGCCPGQVHRGHPTGQPGRRSRLRAGARRSGRCARAGLRCPPERRGHPGAGRHPQVPRGVTSRGTWASSSSARFRAPERPWPPSAPPHGTRPISARPSRLPQHRHRHPAKHHRHLRHRHLSHHPPSYQPHDLEPA